MPRHYHSTCQTGLQTLQPQLQQSNLQLGYGFPYQQTPCGDGNGGWIEMSRVFVTEHKTLIKKAQQSILKKITTATPGQMLQYMWKASAYNL